MPSCASNAAKSAAAPAHWDLETGRSKNPSVDLLAKALEVSIADLVGENPNGKDEAPHIVAMYRELKDLTPEDRKVIGPSSTGSSGRNTCDLDGTGSPEGIVGKTSLPSALAQS